MAQFTPEQWISTLGKDGYGNTDYGFDHTMTIGRKMTPLQAAAAVQFMLGMNGHCLEFLCDEGSTSQLRGEHIFEHAREFILKHRKSLPESIKKDGVTYIREDLA